MPLPGLQLCHRPCPLTSWLPKLIVSCHGSAECRPLLLIGITRSSAVAKRSHDALCLYSFNTKRRSLLLLDVSASDIPLRTINFFSVLFSSAYSSMLQAVTNKHLLVRRGLCDLHYIVVGNCFRHFVVRTSSNRSIASGAWPTVSYTQLRRR